MQTLTNTFNSINSFKFTSKRKNAQEIMDLYFKGVNLKNISYHAKSSNSFVYDTIRLYLSSLKAEFHNEIALIAKYFLEVLRFNPQPLTVDSIPIGVANPEITLMLHRGLNPYLPVLNYIKDSTTIRINHSILLNNLKSILSNGSIKLDDLLINPKFNSVDSKFILFSAFFRLKSYKLSCLNNTWYVSFFKLSSIVDMIAHALPNPFTCDELYDAYTSIHNSTDDIVTKKSMAAHLRRRQKGLILLDSGSFKVADCIHKKDEISAYLLNVLKMNKCVSLSDLTKEVRKTFNTVKRPEILCIAKMQKDLHCTKTTITLKESL